MSFAWRGLIRSYINDQGVSVFSINFHRCNERVPKKRFWAMAPLLTFSLKLPVLTHSESFGEGSESTQEMEEKMSETSAPKKMDSTIQTEATEDYFDYESDYEVEIQSIDDAIDSLSSNCKPEHTRETTKDVQHDDSSKDGTLSQNDAIRMSHSLSGVMGGFSSSIKDGFCALSVGDFESVGTNEFDLRYAGIDHDGDDHDDDDVEEAPRNPRRRLSLIMRGEIEPSEEEVNMVSAIAMNAAEIEGLAIKREWAKIPNTANGISSYKKGKCSLNFYLCSSTVSCYWMDKRRGFKEIFRCPFELTQINSLFENDGKKKFYLKDINTSLQTDSSLVHTMPQQNMYNQAMGFGYDGMPDHSGLMQNPATGYAFGMIAYPYGYYYAHYYYAPCDGGMEQRQNCRYGTLCKRPNCWFRHPNGQSEVDKS
jgi:hypothetical protein